MDAGAAASSDYFMKIKLLFGQSLKLPSIMNII